MGELEFRKWLFFQHFLYLTFSTWKWFYYRDAPYYLNIQKTAKDFIMIIFLVLICFIHRNNFFIYKKKHCTSVLSNILKSEENEWKQKVLGQRNARSFKEKSRKVLSKNAFKVLCSKHCTAVAGSVELVLLSSCDFWI